MIPYAVSLVPAEDLKLFKKIEQIIQEMPDIDLGKNKNGSKILVSCHMVVRALARFFPLKIHDGLCGYCDHSWFTTESENLIDAYPVGIIGGPILIPTKYFHPFVPLYKEKSLSVVKRVHFKRNVDVVAEAVRQTMIRLGIEAETGKSGGSECPKTKIRKSQR